MKKIISVILSVLMCFSLFGCTDSSENIKGGKMKIVAAKFAEYDFARAVAQDLAEITMIIPPGVESHGFEPTVADIKAVSACDVFICTGGESDTWLESIIKSADNPDMRVIRLVDCVEELCEEEHHGHEHSDGHHHNADEHVWTSPKNAISIVEHIKDVLCDMDKSPNSELYRANAQKYIEELEKLDEDFREVVASAKRKTLIFGDRYPLVYFSNEYGLKYHAAFSGCSEDTEASASKVRELIDIVRDEEIPVVFALELSNQQLAKAIADESGARVLTFYSCHNISKDEFDKGTTYVELMKLNVERLKSALN